MNRKTSQKKLKEIADKHRISLATANDIIRSQWEFVKSILHTSDIEKEYFPIVGVLHLGKFVVTDRKKFFFKEKYPRAVEMRKQKLLNKKKDND